MHHTTSTAHRRALAGRAGEASMRHTEFWARMDDALGPAYARSWASMFVIGELGGRTASDALDAGDVAQGGLGRGLAGPRAAGEQEVTTQERAAVDVVAVQRRTVRTLVVAQAVGAIGITIGIATASLLARDISGSESQAGLAQTFQVLGAAVAAYLLARLMSAPRPALRTGDRLPARRQRRAARRGRRRRRLDGAAAGRRAAARIRRPRPTAAPGTPPPTSPRTSTRAARSRPWCGRPPSARCSDRT